MEDLELLSFNIISAVGTAKSRYVQAMYLAEKGDFERSRSTCITYPEGSMW